MTFDLTVGLTIRMISQLIDRASGSVLRDTGFSQDSLS